MRLAELLNEMRVEEVGDVTVWRDPTLPQLAHLVQQEGYLRGTLYRRSVWLWNAEAGWHTDMDERLGLEGGAGVYVCAENEEAEATEWQGSPYVEGGGVRIYWQDYYELEQLPVVAKYSKAMPNMRVNLGYEDTTD